MKIKFMFANFLRKTYAALQPLIKRFPLFRIAVKKIASLFPSLIDLISYTDSRIYSGLRPVRVKRQIMVDVTHATKTKLNTGIQRVVRSLLKQLSEVVDDNIDVEPVILSCRLGFWHYEYLNDNGIVVPNSGDVFLGLDLNSEIIAAESAGLFKDWKKRNVHIVITVHDILPIEHPEWWPNDVSVNHEKWLRSALLSADTILSVSKTTQEAVRAWCNKNNFPHKHLKFEWFHLGADFEALIYTKGYPEDAKHICNKLKENVTFLSVGTIEPRKGFEQCLSAFELLWQSGSSSNLVFVGKQGWMVDSLVERMKLHPELNKRFFWLDGVSDEYLKEIYSLSDCLIAASNGEGFGIPLIEAARNGLPIIARDIPIFKEVLSNNATYFKGQTAEELANSVRGWLDSFDNDKHISSNLVEWQTWRESALKIKEILNL